MGLGKYKNEKTNAGILIVMKNERDKRIYLIGYDYYSKEQTVNNLYKGTKGYVGTNAKAIGPMNWINHTKRLLNKYEEHEFIHVGEEIEDMKDRKNWTTISCEELNELKIEIFNQAYVKCITDDLGLQQDLSDFFTFQVFC